MPKLATIQIPLVGDKLKRRTREATGLRVLLPVGKEKVRCLIDEEGDVFHFESGYRLGNINAARTEIMCRLTPHHRVSKHAAAAHVLNKLVDAFGAKRVLAEMASKPVLNQP